MGALPPRGIPKGCLGPPPEVAGPLSNALSNSAGEEGAIQRVPPTYLGEGGSWAHFLGVNLGKNVSV